MAEFNEMTKHDKSQDAERKKIGYNESYKLMRSKDTDPIVSEGTINLTYEVQQSVLSINRIIHFDRVAKIVVQLKAEAREDYID